jgi:hypothetical protein
MTELTIMDFIGRVHRENDGRIIIEIPELDQEHLAGMEENVPVRITLEKLDTNCWMAA